MTFNILEPIFISQTGCKYHFMMTIGDESSFTQALRISQTGDKHSFMMTIDDGPPSTQGLFANWGSRLRKAGRTSQQKRVTGRDSCDVERETKINATKRINSELERQSNNKDAKEPHGGRDV